MADARKEFDSIFAAVGALFEKPAVKAFYAAEAKKRADEAAKEAARTEADRLAKEAKLEKTQAYDAYVLNGGSNECIRCGINEGCKPHCPVFMRGECEMQEENAAFFAMEDRRNG